MGITATSSTAIGLRQISVLQREISSKTGLALPNRSRAPSQTTTAIQASPSPNPPPKKDATAENADESKVFFSQVGPARAPSGGAADPAGKLKAKPPVMTTLLIKLNPVTVLLHLLRARLAGPTFVHLMVLRKILLLNDGRDKVLKCVQYATKAVLWLQAIERLGHFASQKGWHLSPILAARGNGEKVEMVGRMEKVVSSLSMSRKIIRLAHFLEPLETLTSFLNDASQRSLLLPTIKRSSKPPPTITARTLALGTLLGSLLGLVNDLSDDAICLAKMGALDKSWIKTCTPLSDRLWFLTILIDLHAALTDMTSVQSRLSRLLREKAGAGTRVRDDVPEEMLRLREEAVGEEIEKCREKLSLLRVSVAKLVADGVFCGFDLGGGGEKGWNEGWQVWAGLVAAGLGTFKLWVKHAK
ncbi:hypothetical protein HDU67_002051 [Dinochytrium kinnereticum]|nr:hypothetical protein HDU67_002051 [Dinochytrium kinnereticum]